LQLRLMVKVLLPVGAFEKRQLHFHSVADGKADLKLIVQRLLQQRVTA